MLKFIIRYRKSSTGNHVHTERPKTESEARTRYDELCRNLDVQSARFVWGREQGPVSLIAEYGTSKFPLD